MSSAKGKSAKTTKRKGKAEETSAPARGFLWMPIVLLMAAGQLLVWGARVGEGRSLTLMDVWPWVFWAGSGFGLCLALRMGRFTGYAAMVPGVLLLSGLGVLVRSRISGVFPGVSDMHWAVQPLGVLWLLLAWMASRRGRMATWRPFWGLAALGAFALAGGMLVLGTRYRGGLYAPGGMTPTELLKLLVPFALAGYFSGTEARWGKRPPWFPPLGALLGLGLVWGTFCLLLALQRDLGLVLLLSLVLVVVLILATERISWGVVAVAGAAGAIFGVVRVFAHGARRVAAWLDPFSDPTGAGWQVLQGLSGLYAGGLVGTGPGSGRPERLPIASSDFIYAVYGEEWGYIGCLCLLVLYAHLFRAGIQSTRLQVSAFPRLLAGGVTAALMAQTLVNLAGVVNLLPITGITLPFISQGGSSYWVVSVWFGLLLGLSEPAAGKHRKR